MSPNEWLTSMADMSDVPMFKQHFQVSLEMNKEITNSGNSFDARNLNLSFYSHTSGKVLKSFKERKESFQVSRFISPHLFFAALSL